MPPDLTEKGGRLRNSCDFCTHSKLRCNGGKPACRRCLSRDQPCLYSPARRPGRRSKDHLRAEDVSTTAEHSAGHATFENPSTDPPSRAGEDEERSSGISQAPAAEFHSAPMQLETAERIRRDSASFMDLGFDGIIGDGSLFDFSISECQREADGCTTPRPMDDDGPYGLIAVTPISIPFSDASLGNPNGMRPHDTSVQTLMERAHHSGRQTHVPNPADLDATYDEASIFSQISSMIDALSDQLATSPGACADPQHNSSLTCSCAAALARLQLSVLHPVLSSRKRSFPLDLLLLLEESIFQTHKAIAECSTCRPYFRHALASVCICTDWIVDALTNATHRYASTGRYSQLSAEGSASSTHEWSRVRIGALAVDECLWQQCVQALIKHRLRRFVIVIRSIADPNSGEGGPLSSAIRLMGQDIHHKMESLLGTIELWESGI